MRRCPRPSKCSVASRPPHSLSTLMLSMMERMVAVDVPDVPVEDHDAQPALDEAEHMIERERRRAEDDAADAVRPE